MRNNYSEVEETASMSVYVAELAATGDYPQLSKLITEHGTEGVWDIVGRTYRDPQRFERNLRRLLDGIAADLEP
jgi:hypothetical protein